MAYKMCMVFTSDVVFPEINALLKECRFDEHPVFEAAVETKVEQTVGFIPNEAALKAYAAVIDGTTASNGMQLTNTRFVRYDYLLPVEEANADANT